MGRFLAALLALLTLHAALAPSLAQAQQVGAYPAPVVFSTPDPFPGATLGLGFVPEACRGGQLQCYKAFGAETASFTAIPNLTVSRASTGYAETRGGQLLLFGPNVARITDKGLLVEEARTNIARQSQDLTVSPWQNGGTAPVTTANVGTAPDGTATASRVVFSGADTNSRREVPTSGSNTAGAYVLSVYARVTTGTAAFRLSINDSVASQISSDLTVTTTWQRFTVAFTTANTGTYVFQLRNSTVAAANDIQFWGAQLEAGSFPTSYIPTTSASATRAADAISIAGLSVALTVPFTMQAWGALATSMDATDRYFVSTSDGTANNEVHIRRSNSNNARGVVTAATVAVGASNAATYTGAATIRSAIRVRSAAFMIAANGLASADTAATGPAGMHTLWLGNQRGAGSTSINGYLQLVTLRGDTSDAQLQALTQ